MKLSIPLCFVLCFAAWGAGGRAEAAEAVAPRLDLEAKPEDAEWFRDAKFGLMVHSGPVNLTEKEMSWSRGGDRPGLPLKLRPGGNYTPVEVYDNLYKRYNPAQADARQWVDVVKQAGAKYLVFITKHHDGFVEFDSQLTDYKITSPECPFGRDLVKELAEACHQGGVRLGLYYSQPDWHHPDAYTKDHDKYIRYLHGQVRELCSNYGQVDVMWFDGLYGTAKDWDAENLVKMIRGLQPHALINNRLDHPCGAAGIRGDFDTPEGAIGAFQQDRPWETVMPISRQWAWNSHDTIMTLQQCQKILLYVVGSDGNFLLNVGVMPNGQFDPQHLATIRQLGQWLETCGQSIYGTRGGPYKPGLWGVSTCHDKTVYLHVMDWAEPVRFPLSGCQVVSAEVLTGGTAKVEQNGEYFSLDVAPPQRDPLDTIVKLELSHPASRIAPCNAQYPLLIPYESVTSFPKISPKWETSDPKRAFDNDWSTHWETPPGGWLEVDLGRPVRIDRIAICEARPAFRSAVRKFQIQYKTDDSWQKLDEGQNIGFDWSRSFEPVTARYVRLDLTESKRVAIREMCIFGPPQ